MNRNFILVAGFILFCTFCQAQSSVPPKIIGNWVNSKTNNWEYGFCEKFAIYETDFWDYASVKEDKKSTTIVLTKGGRQVSLKVSVISDSLVSIASGSAKALTYKLYRPGYFPYPEADHTPFKHSGFKPDSVTIIGYYRNLDKLKARSQRKESQGPFKVGVPNFILDESEDYFADFDSLGRFIVKFPVLNTQEVYVDWGRFTKQLVVEPGEKLFLFADIEDFLPGKGEGRGRNYRNRPKHVVFMGANARVHNEVANYPLPTSRYFDSQGERKKDLTDLEFLETVKNNYDSGMAQLQAYIQLHPTVSDRFKEYQAALEKYDGLAFHLMQYRFTVRSKNHRVAFDSGYMEFVNKNIPVNEEQYFTMAREFSAFIRDYTDYYKGLSDKMVYDEKSGRWRVTSPTTSATSADVLGYLKKSGQLTKEEEDLAEKARLVFKQTDKNSGLDSVKRANLLKENQKLLDSFNAFMKEPKVEQAFSNVMTKKHLENQMKVVDSLIQNKNLKELLLARHLCQKIDHERQPLDDVMIATLQEKVTNPFIKQYVLAVNQRYIDISNKKITYEASLKSTEHLKEFKDAEALFKKLIEPYKGKVIYLDFWGTWCGPCKQQMPFASVLKKELAGKDVIFMYMANRSPEKSWKNVINEMDLSGENVVHYRLPDDQQAMIERKFAVNKFPTYVLLDKEGKMVSNDAPRPEMKSAIMKEIDSLLK